MRDDSPRWEEVNPSNHPHERDGLRELASYLPDADPYRVWANVEFVGTDGSINEVDALVLTRSGLYVVELKHWQGEILGSGTQWTRRPPNGRLTPEDNPYILANRKAKRLASLIKHYAPRDAQVPYVGAIVFLHARNARSRLDPIGRQHVYGLDGQEGTTQLPSLKRFLLDPPQNPRHLVDVARGRQIGDLVRGAKLRPSVAERKLNQLLLHPRPFAEGIGWQDFLAGHILDTSLLRRVRFYLTSRAAEEDVPAIRRAAEREFRLLQGIHHPGIAHAVDLAEHPWGPAVVFDHHRDWTRLDRWLVEREEKLHLAQRLQLIQDLAEILDYAHARRLAHRSLHPRAIFVANPETARPSLVVTDWQTGARTAGTSLTQLGPATDPAALGMFFDDEVRRYQAPEVPTLPRLLGHQLDVFSLGAIAYRILAGRDPAATPEELLAAVTDGGFHLEAAVDGMPGALIKLIYDATRGDPAQRLRGVAEFRAKLEEVWEELTRPEPEPVVDPLSAHKGAVLDGGLTVKARLGSGATATALLVTRPGEDGKPEELVLKVARNEQHRERFSAEAQTLEKIRDWRVAALVAGPIVVGSRTALLMQSAGERTLAEELRGGRLALDLLERYGRDLLEIVAVLDGYGVWHRDIKPANLAARPRPSDKQPHLCIFDFSLSATPADQLGAGTVNYLDPFLGPPRRLRYDAAAERFAAAVTLYEMATGTLPRWGDNANPAVISEEVTLDPTAFDPAVADRMVEFFGRALARDDTIRFDTIDEMTDAWRAIFRELPDPESAGRTGAGAVPLHRGSPLDVAGLSARARSALERLNVHTVGELLDAKPSELTRAKGVPDATRKEILAQARSLRAELALAGAGAGVDGAGPVAGDHSDSLGIDALCAALLPAETSRNRTQRATLRVLLGQATGDGDTFAHWPTPSQTAARVAGQGKSQVSNLLRRYLGRWAADPGLSAIRNEIVVLLDGRGAVMSSVELADALLVAYGSYSAEPKRTAQAIGLVRAAVEAELSLGGNARLAIHRFRHSDLVLVGREPDDVSVEGTAADLLGYVLRLGRLAGTLVRADPLPTRQRAVEQLRTLEPPALMPPVSDTRLLQLAAAGSNGEADVNVQGQLYPVRMPAARALRLAAGALIGQSLTADELRDRVRSRFPRAEELPARPKLDRLLAECEVPLVWHALPAPGRYDRPETLTTVGGGTRMASSFGPALGPDAAAEAHVHLVGVVERHGFLVVLASIRRLAAARRALLARLRLSEVDVTGILLDRLRVLGFPWEAIVAADNGSAADSDFRSLVDLVRHDVVPAIGEALAAVDGPVLLTEAAPLARYGQLRVIQELADPTRPRPAARLLLVPVRRPEAALLDGEPIPLVSPASQSLWLPEDWLSPPSVSTVEPTARAGS